MAKKIDNLPWVYVFLVLVYLVLVFSIPPDPATLARYNLTLGQARMLNLAIVVPLLAIWSAAFYGLYRLHTYAKLMRGNDEGRGFVSLAKGIGFLTLGLPISSILSSTLNYFARLHPSSTATMVITINYVNILISIAAFTYIAKGARELVSTTKKVTPSLNQVVTFLGFLVLSGVYVYLTFQNPIRNYPAAGSHRATHFLPDWLILLTIIVPNLYVWYVGFRATADLSFFKEKVKGTIYKQFLGFLAAGIGTVLVSSIFIQFLTALSSLFTNLPLTPLLALIYLLLVIIAAGYVLIAVGAKKLRKIEEV